MCDIIFLLYLCGTYITCVIFVYSTYVICVIPFLSVCAYVCVCVCVFCVCVSHAPPQHSYFQTERNVRFIILIWIFHFPRNVPSSIPTHFASSLTSFGRKPISILLGPHTGHFKDIQLPTAILQYYSTILSNSSFGLGVGVDFGTTRTLI